MIAHAVAESLDQLRPWMPWATPSAATSDGQLEWLHRVARSWSESTDFVYVSLTPDGEVFLGTCGLHHRIGPKALEIGYWVHIAHTNHGYATAAARALTMTALGLPDIDRVEIHCDQANLASQAIPRKLGYRLDRIEDDEIEAPGEIGKSMIWEMARLLANPHRR